jgi:O-methyltransferase involved in polyketide biosynthesis
MDNSIYEPISYTAEKILQKKARDTSILYAKELADTLKIDWKSSKIKDWLRTLIWGRVRPGLYLELRYNAISQALQLYPESAVLEIAAGYSTRGLIECMHREAYIETDLDKLIFHKEKVIDLMQEGKRNPCHYFKPLNICNPQSIEQVGNFIQSLGLTKPVVVIHEGLFMYLNTSEQQLARDNIKTFLAKYSPDGAWITTDFSERDLNLTILQQFMMKKLSREVERKLYYFPNDDAVTDFLQEANLNFTKLPNLEAQNNELEVRSVAEEFRAYQITLN